MEIDRPTHLLMRFTFFFFLSFVSSSSSSSSSSFSSPISRVRLIHRDSVESPLYNPNLTVYHRNRHIFARSLAHLGRHKRLHLNSLDDFQPSISPHLYGQYIVSFTAGSPQTPVTAFFDISSSFSGLPCLFCKNCSVDKVFDPSKSSTYKTVVCGGTCDIAPNGDCFDGVDCHYNHGSETAFSKGILAIETFNFSTDGVESFLFGCGDNNNGILGFGQNGLSMPEQLSTSPFSYCLTPPGNPSNMRFGRGISMLENTAPIVPVAGFENLYTSAIEAITFGSDQIPQQAQPASFDTVVAITALSPELFDPLLSQVKGAVKLKVVVDPNPGASFSFQGTTADLNEIPQLVFSLWRRWWSSADVRGG